MRERKFSTSVQLTETQLNTLEEIVKIKSPTPSNAEVLRDAFDFYVSVKFPQFLKKN